MAMRSLVPFVVGFVLLMVFPAEARTYFITPQDPWLRVLNNPKSLKPGDELVFKAGVYDAGNTSINIKFRGKPRRRITIRAEEGAKVLISRPNADRNMMDLRGTRYLTVQGFEMTGGSSAIRIHNDKRIPTRFLTLKENHIHHIGGPAITANTPGSRYEGLEFLGNHIHNTDAEGEAFYLGCNDNKCQFFDGILEKNYIHDLVSDGSPRYQGDGIEIKKGSYNNIIRENLIVNTNYPGITVYGVEGQGGPNIIERNVLLNIQDHGIQAAADAEIRNNLILNASYNGIHSQPHQGVVPGNLDIVNNTICADGLKPLDKEIRSGVRINSEQGFSGPVLLANNALYMDAHGDAIRLARAPKDPPVTLLNNLGAEGTIHKTRVPFDKTGNAERDFVDLKNYDVFPKKGSKLIAAASAEHQPEADLNATSRKGSNDVGAFVYDPKGNPNTKLFNDFRKMPANQ